MSPDPSPKAAEPSDAREVTLVSVTYRRAELLDRMLHAVRSGSLIPGAAIIVDNGDDAATRGVVAHHSPWANLVLAGANLGVGGGLALGIRQALEHAEVQRIWTLDDDAIPDPGCLCSLVRVAQATKAGLVVPCITDHTGRLSWLPGFTDRKLFRAAQGAEPATWAPKCTETAPRVRWATGISWLLSRQAIEEGGLPRTDYLMLGEDIEYTLRIARSTGGRLATGAVVAHLPPDHAAMPGSHEIKFCALLQNLAYTGTRLPGARFLLRAVAADLRRCIRTFGWGMLPFAVQAVWNGALLGQPAGGAAFARLRSRVQSRRGWGPG